MADKVKYSQKPIDVALDEIGEVVTALSEQSEQVTRLITELAGRVADLERRCSLAGI